MKAKAKRIALRKVLARELEDSEFKFYFEREKAIGDIARLVRAKRRASGLTQAALARKARTTQAAIARLESGLDRRIPSLGLLERIARVLKARLTIGFETSRAA